MQKPVVKKVGKYTFELMEDFTAEEVTVPAGFRFDGATVPRLLWTFFNPVGELFEASIVHDYLYKQGIGTKRDADKKFLAIANQYGANRAWAAYLAVRVGGRGNF